MRGALKPNPSQFQAQWRFCKAIAPLSSLFIRPVEMLLEYERDQLYDDEKVIDKEEILCLALSQLAGDFDGEHTYLCTGFFTIYTPVISTGSVKLYLALGIGGIPKGRMMEIIGREACGKTTLALHIVKEAQMLGDLRQPSPLIVFCRRPLESPRFHPKSDILSPSLSRVACRCISSDTACRANLVKIRVESDRRFQFWESTPKIMA